MYNIKDNFIKPIIRRRKKSHFIDNNVKNNPGKTSLKFNIIDNSLQKVLTLSTVERGFTLNDEMVEFLIENKQIDISVSTIA